MLTTPCLGRLGIHRKLRTRTRPARLSQPSSAAMTARRSTPSVSPRSMLFLMNGAYRNASGPESHRVRDVDTGVTRLNPVPEQQAPPRQLRLGREERLGLDGDEAKSESR